MPQTNKKSSLTRTVWALSVISLLADITSEMLYPILPIYLAGIGFSAAWIGILEGLTEAVAGLSKGWFGALSDRMGRRMSFVSVGYFLSGIAKPAIGFVANPLGVFAFRALDRLGKGVRTAPRDAVLADESLPETRARVFGFHRGMDTLGATLGPALALWVLWNFPGEYRLLFLWAFLPGLLAAALTLVIREHKKPPKLTKSLSLREGLFYWRTASADYRRFTLLMMIFALVNSSDMFLLMKLKTSGLTDNEVVGAYILFNAVYAALSYPMGSLGDRFGTKRVLAVGLAIFGVVYCGFAIAGGSIIPLLILIALYGLYAAATQGISRAIVAGLCPPDERATALGAFAGLQSIFSLAAGLLAGAIWTVFSPEAMFVFSGAVALLLAPLMIRFRVSPVGN